jgi:hypothetical protein
MTRGAQPIDCDSFTGGFDTFWQAHRPASAIPVLGKPTIWTVDTNLIFVLIENMDFKGGLSTVVEWINPPCIATAKTQWIQSCWIDI